jgi:hypothetical protein
MAKGYTQTSEEELKKEINEQFLFAKRYLDPVHERMNQQEELYRSYIDKSNYPHGAKVFDPRIFRVVETVTPRMVANEPTGSFYPSEEGDMSTAHILNILTKYDWRRAEMFPKLVMFVKSMLIFGTAFGRNYWDFREKVKTRMVPKMVDGRTVWTPKEKEQVKVTEFDGPNFEPLNIYDCFPDPNATSMRNMRWFIYRTFRSLKELKAEDETRGTGYYKNLDQLETMVEEKKGKAKKEYRPDYLQFREHRRIMLSTSELVGQDESNPDIVVLRRFTREGWCDYLPEYDMVIREVENPYFHGEIPIVYGVDYPYPGELYGIGEIEPVDRIQRAINAVLNQRLDNVQLTLRNMWKVKKDSGVDLHTLVSAPGNIVLTSDMTAVEPLQVPDVTGPTFVQTMNYLTSALQNGTGITDYTVGINTGENTVNKTATGTRLIQQEANAQFKLKIQLFNHMVVEQIANQWKDLRIQYTTEPQKLRIVGQQDIKYLKENTKLAQVDVMGAPIYPGELERASKLQLGEDENFAFLSLLPEDIQPSIVGDYDFVATTSSETTSDPIALQENFFTALDRVANPLWVQGLAQQNKQLNFPALTEKVFDKLNLGIESKDVLTDLQPAQPQQPIQPQQDPMAQMAQMAPEMGMQPMGAPAETGLPTPDQLLASYGQSA